MPRRLRELGTERGRVQRSRELQKGASSLRPGQIPPAANSVVLQSHVKPLTRTGVCSRGLSSGELLKETYNQEVSPRKG